MVTIAPICVECKRFRNDLTCEAYPDRIPDAILDSKVGLKLAGPRIQSAPRLHVGASPFDMGRGAFPRGKG